MSTELIIKQIKSSSMQERFAKSDSGMNFDREAGFAIQTIQSNSALQKCSTESILKAVYNIALTGLSLNPVLKEAYLVPRGGKCILDPSYVGLTKILTDSGSVKFVQARIVYDCDDFYMDLATNEIQHRPAFGVKDKKFLLTYAIAKLPDGSIMFDYMEKDEVDAIMKRSKAYESGSSPWKTDYFEMVKKTMIRRFYKTAPKSKQAEKMAEAINIDDMQNGIDFQKEAKMIANSKQQSIISSVFGNGGESEEVVDVQEAQEVVEQPKNTPTPPVSKKETAVKVEATKEVVEQEPTNDVDSDDMDIWIDRLTAIENIVEAEETYDSIKKISNASLKAEVLKCFGNQMKKLNIEYDRKSKKLVNKSE